MYIVRRNLIVLLCSLYIIFPIRVLSSIFGIDRPYLSALSHSKVPITFNLVHLKGANFCVLALEWTSLNPSALLQNSGSPPSWSELFITLFAFCELYSRRLSRFAWPWQWSPLPLSFRSPLLFLFAFHCFILQDTGDIEPTRIYR